MDKEKRKDFIKIESLKKYLILKWNYIYVVLPSICQSVDLSNSKPSGLDSDEDTNDLSSAISVVMPESSSFCKVVPFDAQSLQVQPVSLIFAVIRDCFVSLILLKTLTDESL
ncbi:hypothetical protein RIR_jg4764.t1 [Rhizophagus irregularis DAOM 181602=DAOM 197198]|nr:hypothetical protein RIR_jg4764.t1 [Rhizophagus irregularis DAOM 181602=DAOM 197198]